MKAKHIHIFLATACLAFVTSCAEINSPDEPTNPSGSSHNSSIKTDGEVITEGAVDLGLSVKWAACNLGTSVCFSDGTEYSEWGDTRSNCLLNICGTEYDQATEELGAGWQLPSYEQAKELFENCRWTLSQYRGVDGYIVTGPSRNAIFIPAPQNTYYWTGTCDVNSNRAYCMYLPSYSWSSREIEEINRTYSNYYSSHRYIRPVYIGS